MKTIHEMERDIPVIAETDILVAGGGPAGTAAALAAARCGARVMIVENNSCLGGIATSGMMSHWTGGTFSPIMNELQDACHQIHWPVEDGFQASYIAINHEKLKLVLFNKLDEAGVVIRTHTLCADVVMDGTTVRGVILESKSGREAVLAKVVIDATGDGDIAAKANVPFRKGRDEDERMQPVTLMFKIAGVDYSRAIFPGSFESYVQVPKGEIQALGKQILPKPAGHTLLYRSTQDGHVVVNMTNLIDIDGTNADDLTKAEIETHRQIPLIIDFLREYAPGYENCYLLASAEMVGVRETRHFEAEYIITGEDIMEATVFPDWIATKLLFNFDIHNLDGAGLDKNGAQRYFHCKGKYTIPYRCCVPKVVDNLLLAGRDICGTHKAHSNFRVMPICANIGQGIGVAAAQAVKDGVKARDVDVAAVQEVLKSQGVEP